MKKVEKFISTREEIKETYFCDLCNTKMFDKDEIRDSEYWVGKSSLMHSG